MVVTGIPRGKATRFLRVCLPDPTAHITLLHQPLPLHSHNPPPHHPLPPAWVPGRTGTFCTTAYSWRCCTYTHSESPNCSDMLSSAVVGSGRPPVAGAAQVPWLLGPAIRRPRIQKLVTVGTVQVVGTPVAASMQAE